MQALEIYKNVIVNNHPDTALTLNNIGMAYQGKGAYD